MRVLASLKSNTVERPASAFRSLVGKGDSGRRRGGFGRPVLGVGGVGVVPRLFDEFAQFAFGLGDGQLLAAYGDLRRAVAVARGPAG